VIATLNREGGPITGNDESDEGQSDWVEGVFLAWGREFPQADTAGLKMITRLARLEVLLSDFQSCCLAPLGLVMSDFMVLAALRRLGEPYQASPSSLYNVLERSSGGMTKMIKRLESMGLVERLPDPDDGRGSLVRLTAEGVAMHEQAFYAFLEGSDAVLDGVSSTQLNGLDRSLQRLVGAFEGYLYE
jgi:DNA-binding MarR family transcriptional regulator